MKNDHQKPREALTIKSHTFKVGDIVTEDYHGSVTKDCQIVDISTCGGVHLIKESEEWGSDLKWLKSQEKP